MRPRLSWPLLSTQALSSNASTSTLLAEISSLANRAYQLHLLIGATTLAAVYLEQVLSTGLGDTALQTDGSAGQLGRVPINTASDQTAEYILPFQAQTGDRVRVRPATAVNAGEDVSAKIALYEVD